MEEIVKRVLEGGSDSYQFIIAKYQQVIYRYIYKMVSDTYIAEELTQDVFVTGFYNLTKYDDTYAIKTWLYKIAKNTSLNYFRKMKRERLLMDKSRMNNGSEGIHMDMYHGDEYGFTQEIETAFETLKVDEKNLLLLKSVEEVTYKELAMIYEVKEATIRKRYERVRKKFQKAYVKPGKEDLCQI